MHIKFLVDVFESGELKYPVNYILESDEPLTKYLRRGQAVEVEDQPRTADVEPPVTRVKSRRHKNESL